jgi:biopolymer transport protein ExbB
MARIMMMLPGIQDGAAERTLGEFLASGGELMVPIGICSVLVLALGLERALALRRRRLLPEPIRAAVAAIRAGEAEAARATLEDDRSFAARVVAAGFRRRGYPLRDVEAAMEDQALKEIEKLRRNVRPLVLIGGIAPLLGLLGTVLGIADAFRRVSASGMGKPEALAGGIELALTTTIAGLCVAIPAMVVAAWLQGRIRRLSLWVDEQLAPAVEHLAARPEGLPVRPEGTHAA